MGLRSEKKMMQLAFEASLAKFAKPNFDVTLWTIQSADINPWLGLVWEYFETIRNQDADHQSEKSQARIARRVARYQVDPKTLAERPLSLNT